MSKKYSNIDDLFRDKLKDFEANPPEYVWEKVQNRIPKKQGKGTGKKFPNGGLAGTALILVLTGIFSISLINGLVDTHENISETTPEKTMYADHQTDLSNSPVVRSVALQTQKSGEIIPVLEESQDGDKGKKKQKKKPKRRVKASDPSKNATIILHPVTTGTPPASQKAQIPLMVRPIQAYSVNPGKITASIGLRTTEEEAGPSVAASTASTEKIVRMKRTENAPGNGLQSDYSAINRWSLGLYYTPEMIVYPSDDQMKNYSQSLDIMVSYSPGSYFLQTGIGVAQYRDQGNQVINYNKYLGSYEDVYHVTFDTTASGITPVFHTETVHVYDSVTHVVISPSKRRFTYLQIPLFIGYEKLYKRFGWNVRCGPSVSFLLSENVPGGNNSMEQARILGIDNELPGRIQTNWQFVLSAGLTYKLGNTINLNVEPMFRYYIRSAYENNTLNTRHPWSAGLRTGLSFRF